MTHSATLKKRRLAVFLSLTFFLFFVTGYAQILPNVTSFCNTPQTYTTGTSITHWGVSPGGIVSLSAFAGSSTTLTRITNGDITLTATISDGVHPPVVWTKDIYVGGPVSSFTIQPFWYTEPYEFCTNSLSNNFEVISGAIPDITSFEWGISPSTVLEADGWLQYFGMVFSSPGYYQVYCRAKNACGYGKSATQTYNLYASDCVGGFAAKGTPKKSTPEKDNGSPGFSLYPNPALNLVTVTVPDNFNLKTTFIRVVDPLGKPVKTVTGLTTRRAQVNITSLSSGNYIVEINDKLKRQTKRIIKQ